MRLRQHSADDAQRGAASAGGDGPLDASDLRDRAAALAAAADDVIARALSRNSAEYLAQNRQAGGQ